MFLFSASASSTAAVPYGEWSKTVNEVSEHKGSDVQVP